MTKKHPFEGTGVAMITPFKENGDMDYQALIRHTNYLIDNRVDYLVVLGTTAETPALSHQEKLDVIELVKKTAKGRVPLVIGAGGNNTSDVIRWMEQVGSDGIDAYLSVVPYYNKPSQAGMISHFSTIAATTDVPLLLYNVPGRTGSNMQADTTVTLAQELGDKLIGIKEASGDLTQITHIIREKPESFLVISGDDAMTLPLIALGASGVISVIGNALPELFTKMVVSALQGDFDDARTLHYRLLPLFKAIFKEGNPAGVKALMSEQDMGVNALRLPLIPASKNLQEEISQLFKTL